MMAGFAAAMIARAHVDATLSTLAGLVVRRMSATMHAHSPQDMPAG